MHIHTRIPVYVHVDANLCICVCIQIFYTYIYIYIFIETETEREGERERWSYLTLSAIHCKVRMLTRPQGFVADEVVRNTPHAFSHFTFEASGAEQIVVDIQGAAGSCRGGPPRVPYRF